MMSPFTRFAGLALLLLLLAGAAVAEVRLPSLLSDGVVLQRDTPVQLWGWADEGETVTVRLDGEKWASTTAGDGRWQVLAPARPAGGPHQVTIEGDNTLTIDDAWFGDVWLASGQSNMEYPLSRLADTYADEIAAADLPRIRQFKVPKAWDFQGPRSDIEGAQWQAASPDTVPDFSAVAFFFARDIQAQYDIPIGIINASYGGSPAEGWLNEDDLAPWPHYLAKAQAYQDEETLANVQAEDQARNDRWYAALEATDPGLSASPPWFAPTTADADWATFEIPGQWRDSSLGEASGLAWFRRHVNLPAGAAGQPAVLRLGRIVDADRVWVNGTLVGETTYQYPQRRYEIPAGLLKEGDNVIAVRVVSSGGNGAFVPEKPYRLEVAGSGIDLTGAWKAKRGATAEPLPGPEFQDWNLPLAYYNAMLAPLTPMTLEGVIWYQGESNVKNPAEYALLFPAMIQAWRRYFDVPDLPFLFVQLANFLEAREQPVDSDWAETREAQAAALALPHTGMATAIDVGEWNDIHPTDKRSVGQRLALAARKVAYGETDLVASGPTFADVRAKGRKLVIEFDHVGSGLAARGEALQGFAVAAADVDFHWAEARIDGDTVIVSSEQVSHPARVRYAWADNPDSANLYNEEGLPAPPFRAAVPR